MKASSSWLTLISAILLYWYPAQGSNTTFLRSHQYDDPSGAPWLHTGPTLEERQAERARRLERRQSRKARVQQQLSSSLRPEHLQKMPTSELEKSEALRRRLGWGGGNSDKTTALDNMADPGEEYDMWQQAYRMLGAFIDCDHAKSDEHGSGSGDRNNNNQNYNQQASQACSRWMMWASYVDPNYQGNGYYEYFGDEPVGTLDCHNPDTEWQLLGVYRQEFYQFIEQISKHLWAIDDYEYVVALAGLSYMTDSDCFAVGSANDGTIIYAGVAPQPQGKFQMALYTDQYCLTPNEKLGMTYDDFELYTSVSLSSHDNENGDDDTYSYAQEWWEGAQEYTLTELNDVYDDFKYCTSCIDYPTYQDGYFIGDDGTDEDDLINQCWKFYSHDSFPCEGDCITLGHAQGTILAVTYGGYTFGSSSSSYYTDSAKEETGPMESRWSRLLANAFVTLSFVIFVATFLAFAVARRSRYRESRSSKSRRLLDEDDTTSPRSRKSTSSSRRRSKSREDGDGLFRDGGDGAGGGGDENKKTRKRSKSAGKRRSKSKSRGERDGTYEPPIPGDSPRRGSRNADEGGGDGERRRSSSRKSRRHLDDF